VLGVLHRQQNDLGKLIRNTGVVFGAISERDHALRHLITNSDQVFTATDQRDKALRQIFRIFPTFLDESKATLIRLQRFANNTKPLVVDLQPVARKLNPTVRDLADLSPNLRALFHDLGPLITASQRYLPDAARVLRGTAPVLDGLHSFLQELNPIFSYLNYDSRSVTAFLSNGAATANYRFKTDSGHSMHALAQFGIISNRSFAFGGNPDEQEGNRIPKIERANAYPDPSNYLTAGKYGIIQSFSCANVGGNKSDVEDKSPPCHEQGPQAWDGKLFPRLERGKAPNVKAPATPYAPQTTQPKHYK
jgi:phospholipid/cholesterol/gamma-HCH transport system substrate-binding protein